jgi:hypothetical protein
MAAIRLAEKLSPVSAVVMRLNLVSRAQRSKQCCAADPGLLEMLNL